MRRSNSTIYVGNLPGDVRESEIEDLFYKYGRIIDIDLKLPPRPPGYCFIEFDDRRDAEDAIRGRDGYKFDGHRLRVEIAHGGVRSSSIDTYGSYSSGGRSYKRTGYRVIVHGLPSSASWQDLKDHMRRAGDVCFAEVFRRSGGAVGIVDYTSYEDMKYAIRKLDDSEFRNPFSRSYLRVKEDRGHRSSYSRSRSCSPSYDYYRRGYRGRSYSRSYPRSPSYSRSHSYDSENYRRSRSRSQSVYSQSLSRSISNSPSYSYSRSLSRSQSRSRSPVPMRSVSQSRSRSWSRSRSPTCVKSRRSISASCSHSYSGSPLHQGKVQSPSQGPGVRTLSPRSEDDDASPSQASPDSDAD